MESIKEGQLTHSYPNPASPQDCIAAPKAILKDIRLSEASKVALILLFDAFEGAEFTIWDVMGATGFSRNKASSAISGLVNTGFLVRDNRKRVPTLRIVTG